MRGLLQAAAGERDEALVAAHVGTLVDGHRQMALAEQCAGVLRLREARLVVARIGAQAVGRLEVDHQERHRPVGLGLQDEAAVEFQRRAEQGRQHDGLAEQLADRRRIGVLGEDVVERRPHAGEAPTQIEGGHFERQHGVVDRHGRGCPAGIEMDVVVGGIGYHRAYLGMMRAK